MMNAKVKKNILINRLALLSSICLIFLLIYLGELDGYIFVLAPLILMVTFLYRAHNITSISCSNCNNHYGVYSSQYKGIVIPEKCICCGRSCNDI